MMMKRIVTLLALIAFCVTPCMAKKIKGNGHVVTKQLSVGEYSAISLGSGVTRKSISWLGWLTPEPQISYVFNYKQGESTSLQITIDENLYPYIKAGTSDGELTIAVKDDAELVPTTLLLSGTSRGLDKIHMSSKARFILQSPLKGDGLEAQATSGGRITMKQPVQMNHCSITVRSGGDGIFDDLACETIKCRTSSGSGLTLRGKAKDAQYETSSGSGIHAGDFIVERLACSSSSGSSISAHVTDNLEASASSGSDIRYKGSPKTKNSSSSGGSIRKEGH